jgi:hypothetical protein
MFLLETSERLAASTYPVVEIDVDYPPATRIFLSTSLNESCRVSIAVFPTEGESTSVYPDHHGSPCVVCLPGIVENFLRHDDI